MSYSSNRPSLQNQLPLSVEISADPKELRYDINDLYQTIASAVNNKIGGLYVPEEKINSEQYFDAKNVQKLKQVYRITVDFGSLPNATSKSVSHGIIGWNSNYRLTSSWGGATDPVNLEALPIPNDGILLKINSTDVTVTTMVDRSDYTETTIVIEYTKA